MIEAGELNKRVIIERPAVARAANGGETITWTAVDTVYASVEPLTAREMFAAQSVQNDTTIRVRIRYRRDVRPEWRLAYGNRTLEIQSMINVNEANEELVLLCRERW